LINFIRNLITWGVTFTEEEVLSVMQSLPPDKASGPDGFTARFLNVAWDIIREDLMRAFDASWHMDTRNFHTINESLLVLLPKTAEVTTI
jgi:hypothetical protein